MTIAIIHATMNAAPPIAAAFTRRVPDIQIRNFIDEELLARANRVGGVDAAGLRAFYRLAALAADASVDGIMIACSLYCPFADEVQAFSDVPVIAVDAPMMQTAVKTGHKIGVLATTAASGPAGVRKLMQEAALQEKTIETMTGTSIQALEALNAGDAQTHNLLLLAEAEKLYDAGCDLILLSQITMACAEDTIRAAGIPVLSSPGTGADALLERIRRQKQTKEDV